MKEAKKMNKVESREFVVEMEKSGDFWSEEQVEDVYGEQNFERALQERKQQLGKFSQFMDQKLHED